MHTKRARLGAGMVVAVALVVMAASAAAQGTPSAVQPGSMPNVIHACYVPGTGVIYRIKAGGAPDGCTSNSHIEFTWNEEGPPGAPGAPGPAGPAGPPGPPGTSDHSQLINLGNDDHPQYLLTEGVRDSPGGFTVRGTFTGDGHPRVQGPGTRLMWLPYLSALRAGRVDGAQWDGANVGQHSVALGFNTSASGGISTAMGRSTRASGTVSTAMGWGTAASGEGSTAMGRETTASGTNSTAMGSQTTASGPASTAMGSQTTASGFRSTAMGRHASTNNHEGAFVYGDNSTTTTINAVAHNEFAVRASGGFRFRTNAALTTGCNLPAGSGTWSCTSSRHAKMNFLPVDSEEILARLARIPIQSWSYVSEGAQVRHIGPTAQDFHAAFGLGSGEETIAHVDADGINMLAIQALERRTTELRAENAQLRRQNEELERRLARLEALPQR